MQYTNGYIDNFKIGIEQYINDKEQNAWIEVRSQESVNRFCHVKVVHHRCQAIAFMSNEGSCSSFTFYPIDTSMRSHRCPDCTIDFSVTIALKMMPLGARTIIMYYLKMYTCIIFSIHTVCHVRCHMLALKTFDRLLLLVSGWFAKAENLEYFKLYQV